MEKVLSGIKECISGAVFKSSDSKGNDPRVPARALGFVTARRREAIILGAKVASYKLKKTSWC